MGTLASPGSFTAPMFVSRSDVAVLKNWRLIRRVMKMRSVRTIVVPLSTTPLLVQGSL